MSSHSVYKRVNRWPRSDILSTVQNLKFLAETRNCFKNSFCCEPPNLFCVLYFFSFLNFSKRFRLVEKKVLVL